MKMGRIFSALAILFMLPMGFVNAMPTAVPGTAVEYDSSIRKGDEFLGFWEEEKAGEGRLTVTVGENDWYGVEVSWRRNARQVDMWTMSAVPVGKGIMKYSDCSHYLLTFGDKYIEKEELLYENGTGTISFTGPKRIVWIDDQDHVADDSVFIPLRSPLGGGL